MRFLTGINISHSGRKQGLSLDKRVGTGFALTAVGILSIFTLGNMLRVTPHANAAATNFTFAVASDFDLATESSNATSMMTTIGQANPDFLFMNGDYAQNNPPGATQFCSDINTNVNKPVFLVGGNHDTEDGGSGYRVSDYLSSGCSQPTIGTITNFQSGSYGEDYYVDYPAISPKVRIIAISPELGLGDYSSTSPRYTWVSGAIDNAKTNGEWVIVAFHKPYLNAGGRHGDTGTENAPAEEQDVFNLAVSKKADLVINGHEHNYMRSKQLAINTTTCTTITRGSYNSACVGSSGPNYTKDEGAVEIISLGAGSVNDGVGYDSGSGDTGIFANHIDGTGNGYMSYNVTDTTLTGNLISSSGSTLDTFTITGNTVPPADTTAPTVSLSTPVTSSGAVSMTATADDAVGVTSVKFFRDGVEVATDTSAPYEYTWSAAAENADTGTYTFVAKAYDAAGNEGVSSARTVDYTKPTTSVGSFTAPTSDNVAIATYTASGQCSTVASHSDADASKTPSGNSLITSSAFSLTCPTAGNSALVTINLGKQYAVDKLVVYKLMNNIMTNITDSATIANAIINGSSVTTVSYIITDGGTGDEDGAANGTIVDPIYVVTGSANSSGGVLASTGDSLTTYILLAAGMVVGSAIALTTLRRKALR